LLERESGYVRIAVFASVKMSVLFDVNGVEEEDG
jgi:hypothetical protein